MKTDNNKTLITSTVTATVLLLAFQSASAFNPQPEPPGADQMSPVTLPGKDELTAPTLKPAVRQEGVKTKTPSGPPPVMAHPPEKPRAMEPGDKRRLKPAGKRPGASPSPDDVQVLPHFTPGAQPPPDDKRRLKPATAPQAVKAKPLTAPPPLGLKPQEMSPGNDGMPAIKPRAMEPLDKK